MWPGTSRSHPRVRAQVRLCWGDASAAKQVGDSPSSSPSRQLYTTGRLHGLLASYFLMRGRRASRLNPPPRAENGLASAPFYTWAAPTSQKSNHLSSDERTPVILHLLRQPHIQDGEPATPILRASASADAITQLCSAICTDRSCGSRHDDGLSPCSNASASRSRSSSVRTCPVAVMYSLIGTSPRPR